MTVSVEANDPLEARKVVTEAIHRFPKPVPHDRVKHMIIEDRQFLTSVVHDLDRKIPIDQDITRPKD